MIKIQVEVDQQLKEDTIVASKVIGSEVKKVWGSFVASVRPKREKKYTESEVQAMLQQMENIH